MSIVAFGRWVNLRLVGLGRSVIIGLYRLAGRFARLRSWARRSLGGHTADTRGQSIGTLKAVNPFIAFEIGRLKLGDAPIPTSLRETYAQCNEDIIVESVLRMCLRRSGRGLAGVRYLEIGGNHPVQTSSTYLMYRAWGGCGWIVEADPSLAKRLQDSRPRDKILNFAVSDLDVPTVTLFVHEKNELSSMSSEHIDDFAEWGGSAKITRKVVVPNLHINQLVDRYLDAPLDFMSIDIEGMDAAVLKAMNPGFKPTVVQAEWRSSDSVLKEFMETLSARGYLLVGLTEVNAIFVQRDALETEASVAVPSASLER